MTDVLNISLELVGTVVCGVVANIVSVPVVTSRPTRAILALVAAVCIFIGLRLIPTSPPRPPYPPEGPVLAPTAVPSASSPTTDAGLPSDPYDRVTCDLLTGGLGHWMPSAEQLSAAFTIFATNVCGAELGLDPHRLATTIDKCASLLGSRMLKAQLVLPQGECSIKIRAAAWNKRTWIWVTSNTTVDPQDGRVQRDIVEMIGNKPKEYASRWVCMLSHEAARKGKRIGKVSRKMLSDWPTLPARLRDFMCSGAADDESTCLRNCDAKDCGDDGCGGTCGSCAPRQQCESGECKCAPDCSGKSCGEDGCGGTCGSCAPRQQCQSGECECLPNCAEKSCGDDGCGGTCGSCAPRQQCQSGECKCAPDCAGKSCGDDGCGGTCGSCAPRQQCQSGECECLPNCAGKSCGDDGCGGTCGASCQTGAVCVRDQCKWQYNYTLISCTCRRPSYPMNTYVAESTCATGRALMLLCQQPCALDYWGRPISWSWREECW